MLALQNINALKSGPLSDAATIHIEFAMTYTVEITDNPLNYFRTQIILDEPQPKPSSASIRKSSLDYLKEALNLEVVNAFHCNLPTLENVQHNLIAYFSATKFHHSRTLLWCN